MSAVNGHGAHRATRSVACRLLVWLLLFVGASRAGAGTVVGRIDGSFETTPTGGASYSIPLAVGAGPSGLKPALALTYSSQSGDGMAGLGWTVSGFSQITRCAWTIALNGRVQAVQYTSADRFCLDGQPLVLVSGAYGAAGAEYRTEIHDNERIFSMGQLGSGPLSWEVHQGNGQIWRYGHTSDARTSFAGVGTVWALAEVEDKDEQRMAFMYHDTPHGLERKPREVRWSYGQTVDQARFRVLFSWEDRPADDWRDGYHDRQSWRTVQRLNSIAYEFNGGAGFSLVHRYSLAYLTPDAGGARRSRLASVTQCGPADCLPPTTLDWDSDVLVRQPTLFTTLGHGRAMVGDFNGDGASDVFDNYQNKGAWAVWPGNPQGGGFLAPVHVGGAINTSTHSLTLDFNGDGATDLLNGALGTSTWTVYVATPNAPYPFTVKFVSFPIADNARVAANMQALDYDGDGFDDLAYLRDGQLFLARNTGSTYTQPHIVGLPLPPLAAVPMDGANGIIQPADFNGDGRQDMLIARSFTDRNRNALRWEAFVSKGSSFEPFSRDSNLVTAINPVNLYVADINGDGNHDLLWNIGGTWRSFFSNGAAGTGGAFVPDQCTTPIKSASAVTAGTLDIDSDGRMDLAVRYANAYVAYWMYARSDGSCLKPFTLEVSEPTRTGTFNPPQSVDTNGDGIQEALFTGPNRSDAALSSLTPASRADGTSAAPRPELVRRITDGLGNWHQPSYRTMSGWTGYDGGGAQLGASRTLRGAPLALISEYQANTGIGAGSYRMSFTYGNARLDLQGRGLLGFEWIRATDARNGLTTEFAYRQDFPYAGRTQRITVWNGAKKVSNYDAIWSVDTRPVPDAAQDMHFVRLYIDIRQQYEVDPDGGYNGALVGTQARFLTWDDGHAAISREITSSSAAQRPDIVHTTTRAITFDDALRDGSGCRAQPLRVDTTREFSGVSPQTRSVQYTYVLGNCRVETTTEGAAGTPAQQLRTRFTYDSLGRTTRVSRQDSEGALAARARAIAYAGSGAQPVSDAIDIDGEADLVTSQTWQENLALPASRTDAQGQTTSWIYDDFGRVKIERPASGNNTQYFYTSCGPCPAANARYAVRKARADGYWTETYHDSFGRVVGRSFVLPSGAISRQLIEYDVLGRVSRESVPFVVGSANTYWTTWRYDLLDRLKSIDRPVSETMPSGAMERYTYAGLETTMQDAEGRATVHSFDAEKRLIGVRGQLQSTAAYTYTPFGELSTAADGGTGKRTLLYDGRGRLIESRDPDAGVRQYEYNAFGETIRQADGRGPPAIATMRYDQLGRMIERTEPEGTTRWAFHTAAGSSRGLLARVTTPLSSGTPFEESFTYDGKARRQKVTTVIDGSRYETDYLYDALGQLMLMTYPTTTGIRPVLGFGYNYGYLAAIAMTNVTTNVVYQLNETDAGGREVGVKLDQYTLNERHDYDDASGRLAAIRSERTATSEVLQNYAYAWDKVGNLLSRRDAASPQKTETFNYDSLNRLSQVALNGVTTLSMAYRADGAITTKSDVGQYSFGDASRPHAVTAISGGPTGSVVFTYDANGNRLSGHGYALTWTSFNQPRRIAKGSTYSQFDYGPDRRRIRQMSSGNGVIQTTHYVGPHFEVEIDGSKRRYRSNVFAYGRAIYSQVEYSTGGLDGYYLLRDHQGSVDRLVRSVGAGPDKVTLSFDAWGKRRNADWSADPTGARLRDAHWTERGYTGHEHLDHLALVHMNGRIEDPVLGTMLSPDPVMGSLNNPAGLNPYSYVSNNPASYHDPSGYFLSKLRKALKRGIRHVGSFGRRVVRRWGRQIVAAVATYYTAGAASSWAAGAQASGAAVGTTSATTATLTASSTSSMVIGGMAGGAVGGAIATGGFKGMVTGAFTGGMMGGIGAQFGGTYSAGRVVAEGAVSGLSAEMQGGDFGQGFATGAGLSSLTWGALEMREAMIKQSKLDPTGVNARGTSEGFRGDSFKLGGSRSPSEGSWLGGQQGGQGSFFGLEYQAGGFLDNLIETYAGPHDFLNSPFFYDGMGNNASRWSILETVNAANVVGATPFAVASIIPSSMYGFVHE